MKNSSNKNANIARVVSSIVIFLMVAILADNTTAQEKEWDYVILGDSQSWGLDPRYATILEQELGVKINLINRTVGGQHSSEMLRQLRENRDLQNALKKAKVVTFNVPVVVFRDRGPLFDSGKCGGADNQDCFREAVKEYQADTIGIFAGIVSLCNPSKTLVRTMDTHQIYFRQRKAKGGLEVVKLYWQAANKCVIEEAAKHKIPVARVYESFNGPNGDIDPQDTGLMSSDGNHASPKGNDLVAKLFRELGFQYAPQ